MIKASLGGANLTASDAARAAEVSRQYAWKLVNGYRPHRSDAEKARRFFRVVSILTGEPVASLAPWLFGESEAA